MAASLWLNLDENFYLRNKNNYYIKIMTKKLIVALAQLNPLVGDVNGNVEKLISVRSQLDKNVDILVTPELYISGYPIDDLVLREDFLDLVEEGLNKLAEITKDGKSSIIVGAPRKENDTIRNSVFIIENGSIATFRDKYELPNTGVFDEQRIFTSGNLAGPVNIKGVRVGIPICEDIWKENVVECQKESGAEIVISINASPFTLNKNNERLSVIISRIRENEIPIVYLNRFGGQDELVFDGNSFALNDDGSIFQSSKSFEENVSIIKFNKNKKWIGKGRIEKSITKYESLYKALVLGLRDYVKNNKFPGVILGMSGGIDSALVASLAVDALGNKNVHAVMMPSPFTSDESLNDAKEALELLSVKYNELSIKDGMNVVKNALLDFKGPKFESGITEENIQSRLRGLLLMALSNRYGYMLLATGNKSEYAVGYATLYGDMCGGYAPIKDVWKTDVFELCNWRNKNFSSFFLGPNSKTMPENIINKQPTAELRDNQKDTDSLPDYNILDEILRNLVEKELSVQEIINKGFHENEVKKVSKLLSIAEYKRFQSAPGPKVTDKAFGRDRRFPLTSGFSNWN